MPCYNEEKRLDVAAFDRCLAETSELCFVMVNDGSRDGTLALLGELAARHPARVRVLDVQPNQGKAEAVRRGMVLAMDGNDSSYAGFWDADLATPLPAIETFRRR